MLAHGRMVSRQRSARGVLPWLSAEKDPIERTRFCLEINRAWRASEPNGFAVFAACAPTGFETSPAFKEMSEPSRASNRAAERHGRSEKSPVEK